MTTNELLSGKDLADSVQLKVKSLMTLLFEIKQSAKDYEFDSSMSNDFYSYINDVQTDCRHVLNNEKYNLLSNKDDSIQKVLGSINGSKSIKIINNHELNKEELQKFENEIDFQLEEVLKSIQVIENLLNTYQKENALLEEKTNEVYLKLNSQKVVINNEIEKLNNTNIKLENEFNKWKKKLKQQSDLHVSLINEAYKLIFKYQQTIQKYLMDNELQVKENQKEISVKQQQVKDENIKINDLKYNLENKNKLILDTQKLIEKKQLELQDNKLKYEKESKELEIKKLQFEKKQTNINIMKSIMNHQEKEIKEKLQYYQENVILPLELKIEKCIKLVNNEKIKNIELKTKTIELNPEIKKKINEAKSQIEQLNKSLNVQYETINKLKDDFKNIQLDVLDQLNKSTIKSENYMNIFQTIIDYEAKMVNNIEIKEKNKILECEVFQKEYAVNKKKKKLEEEENRLSTQINELKQLIRQQGIYNQELTKQFLQLKK